MIPYGYCHCGCGEKTPIAKRTYSSQGQKKGEPLRYLRGHYANRSEVLRAREPRGPFWLEEDRGYSTPCWIWQFDTSTAGYGRKFFGRVGILAHRWVYVEHGGEIPEGLELDHLCRVRACVNPAHLEPVTHAENSRRGANAKLDWEAVEEMRRLSDWVSRNELAALFGVTHTQVSNVLRGKCWTRPQEVAA